MMKTVERASRYHIRKMSDGDIPQALEIDLDAFPNQWPHASASSFHHELRNKLAYYIVVGEKGTAENSGNGHHVIGLKEIASYIRQLFSQDRFFGPAGQNREYLSGMAGIWMMVDEAHIVTIAVRKNRKNLGLGEWLLINIIELAKQLRAKYVTLEVRVSNKTAQALYEKYGFTRAGTRKKYYSDNGEDALIMTTCELDSPVYQATLQNLKDEHRNRWSQCYPEP
jgi:ribosomal-protein-alanine N-acetyltransferase